MQEGSAPLNDRSPAAEEPDSGSSAARPWPVIPGYTIHGELGRGGMGVVYKASRDGQTGLVALKLIRDGALASAQERARLRIEAESVSRLQHPNIVRILEVGEHLGQPFLAMEYVEGGSLDRRLSGPIAPAIAAQFVLALADAVQYTHERHIVHRDLKPANILLRDVVDNGSDREQQPSDDLTREALPTGAAANQIWVPLISDFGLAKRLDSESTAWTQAGAVLGTARYMAPEQAAGRALEVGPAADIYALGTILYELLAGRPPFQGESWRETIEQVLLEEPSPLATWGVAVPRALETVCFQCLHKEPERRYASAGELAADLARFLNGATISAAPTSDEERITARAAREGFTIVGLLGRGPNSTVYRAQFGTLQQPVALKVIDRGLCNEQEWNSRLQGGAQLWGSLNHPQVLLARQAGWWDGSPYLATELVPPGSLASALATQQFSVQAALRLVEQLTEVVCYLHRQGVIHGNLKPSNVLLAADGIPRVTDFRALSGVLLGAKPVSDSGAVGWGYLAPELIENPQAEARPVTDVYGIGVILYELLAGRPPFAAATPEQLLRQVRVSEPEPLASINRDVSPKLEAFCRRCLRKKPFWRYARAYDVLVGLRRFV